MSQFAPGFRPGWHGSRAQIRFADDPDYQFLQRLKSDPDVLGSAEDLARLIAALNAGSPVDPAEMVYFKATYGKDTEQNSIDVCFRRRTRVTTRNGRTIEYRSGQCARLPEALARAMFMAGSLDCADRSEPERRGWSRILDGDGHERRGCRDGMMCAPLTRPSRPERALLSIPSAAQIWPSCSSWKPSGSR